jgi:hypothetical protein
MSFTTATPQWGSIIDRDADFKPYAQFPVDKTDQDVVLDLIVDGTNEWMQTYLDRPIAPTQFEERFNGWSGWGGAYVMLPYVPILEIVTVNEYWGLSGAHTLVEQTPTYQYGIGYSSNNLPGGTYQINPRTGMLTRTFPGLVQKPFFPGSRNIEVTWIAGYDPIPAQLKLAALEMANHWYRNTQEQAEQAPPFGGQAGEGPVSSSFWPGVPANVVEMLQPFIQQGIG